MRKQCYKGKCVKVSLRKCPEVCRTYDEIQLSAVRQFQADDSIREFRCNVSLSDPEFGDYMTDIVCTTVDGQTIVRECVQRKLLAKPLTVRLLDASRAYWIRKGVYDWGIIIDAEK